MENLHRKIDELHHEIITNLTKTHKRFKERLNEFYGIEHDEYMLQFVEKYLEWETTSADTKYWKSKMFGGIIPEETDVFGPLSRFIANYFYDDSTFSVVWYRGIWDVKGNYVGREEVPSPCDKCYPVIVDDFNGTQEPKVILDAMITYEENQKKEQEEWEKFVNERMSKWRNK
jgi:hypothetical protein